MRLSRGCRIVPDWEIRTPLVGLAELFDGRRELRLIGIQQTGGRVLRVESGNVVLYAADLATLAGSVFDETTGTPLGGATVSLAGTSYRAIADPAGRFAIAGTMDGEYGVTFHHPRLDSLAYTPDPVAVLLRPGRAETVRLTVPAESAIVRTLCPDTATWLLDRSLPRLAACRPP